MTLSTQLHNIVLPTLLMDFFSNIMSPFDQTSSFLYKKVWFFISTP